MDTSETASAIRDFLLELDPKHRRAAYRKAAREYWQWASQIDRNEKAKWQALKRIDEQRRRGRGPLINPKKRPGRGWEWKPDHYLRGGTSVAVEGWVPPAVVRQPGRPPDWPRHEPSSRLSLEVLLAALAVFHDLALPQTPPLMDYHEERPDSLGSFLWHLRRIYANGLGIESLDEPGIDAWGLPIAQDYLARAKALLRTEKGGKRGLPPAGSEAPAPLPPDANPATAKPSGFLGAMDLAKKFNVPKKKMDLLHKRLERFRRKHGNDSRYVIAVDTPGPRESRYLHAVEHVFPVIKDLAQRG